MPAPVILVDVSNLTFRVGFAFQNLSHGGKATGAVYGVLKTILELRAKISPRMIFVWDHGVPVPGAAKPHNWRDAKVTQYKANRHHAPEYRAIIEQMPAVYRALKLLGYCSVSILGMEADDIIGILAKELPYDVRILSTDKDFFQLLDHRVQVLLPKQIRSEFCTATAADIEQQYGVPIPRWAEFLALGGDTADNLNPAPGSGLFGPRTASKLIASGVDLNKPASAQPAAFKAKYGEYWPQIQQSYFAARIPTSWEDPRILDCVKKAGGKPHYHTDQFIKKQETRREKFTQFLADSNMVSLLSVRHQFFNMSNGAQCNPSQPPTHPKPAPKPSRRLF